jgi:hypothetical protein
LVPHIVKTHQVGGSLTRTKNLAGSMTVPAGEPANLFIFFSVFLSSYGGDYCLGLCGQTHYDQLGQEGHIDLFTPIDSTDGPHGIAYDAHPTR